MGGKSSKQKADITTPTKDKAKVKRKKSKKDKDAINGSTGIEEVSIQEKKDDAETIQVEDSSKTQEAEASKKGETDSTGSGNAPTEIVEDSPDKEHQKVAQLSDVQSPSEPSTSPVELGEKELANNETVSELTQHTNSATEVKTEVHSLQETATVKVEQEPQVDVKPEPSAPVTEVKNETLEPVIEIKAPEPVVEKAPEPVAEVEAPKPVVEGKAPEPVVEVKVPEPVAEVKVPEPVAEVKVPEPVAEKKATEPAAEQKTPEPISEVKSVSQETAPEVPEPVTEVKPEEPEIVADVNVGAKEEIPTELKTEENISSNLVAEQNIESTPEQAVDSVRDLESSITQAAPVSVEPTETVEVEKVPSEVESVPVVEEATTIPSPQQEVLQENESIEAKSEVVSDAVSDVKDNQSPVQETISDTISEESTQNNSMPEEVVGAQEVKLEESAPEPMQEQNQNNDLLDDKSNFNSCNIEKESETNLQSPTGDSLPIENDRVNGHSEYQVNGIEIQNGTTQEADNLVNGEVIGNGPSECATLISWNHGGQEVAVCGDFCDWGDNCSLVENEGVFSTKIKLAKGQHHIKFFVDGQWTVDESAPVVELEGHGQVNLLVVTEGSE